MANEKHFTEADIQRIIAEQNKELELKQEQREANKVELGAKLVFVRVQNGAPIMDKTTGEQKVSNGIPLCYPDKYYSTFSFDGGSLEAEIKDKTIFDSLELNKRYFLEGYMGYQKVFGVDTLMPIFTNFTKI